MTSITTFSPPPPPKRAEPREPVVVTAAVDVAEGPPPEEQPKKTSKRQQRSAARAPASTSTTGGTTTGGTTATMKASRGLSKRAEAQHAPSESGISDAELRWALGDAGVKSLPTPFPGSHLYAPDDGKAHPAIILLHGSEGGDAGYTDMRAIYLAKQGFATLAFDYFGKSEGLPKELANVEITRAEDAAKWLAQTPQTAGKRVGLFGVSRGAEQALLLASLQKDTDTFAAVAAHAPHATVVGSFDPKTGGPVIGRNGKEEPAWLVDGTPKTHGPIELEKYNGPVFLSHGTADEVWDAGQTRAIESRLERAGKKAEVHLYPHQGHILGGGAAIAEEQALEAFFKKNLGE